MNSQARSFLQLKDRFKSGGVDAYYILMSPSVPTKCRELGKSMKSFHTKDFHQLLPHLLANIFGYDQTPGWGLQYIGSNHADFNLLYSFLCPSGILFDLLLKLDDREFSYEFPLEHLPNSSSLDSRQWLDCVKHGSTSSICLSAMEYYFYHFAYFVVQLHYPQGTMGVNMQDSLYGHLFEAYMNWYLPFHGIIPVFTRIFHPKERQIQGCHKLSESANKSGFQKDNGSSREVYLETPSERIVEILMMFWVNQYIEDDDILNLSQTSCASSSDVLILLRRLIKHIYYFMNGVTVISEISAQLGEAVQMTDILRRSIITPTLRKRVFQYLQSSLKGFCGDGSYRCIVELWLTYIQPWRYTDPTSSLDKRTSENLITAWRYFILENFPFYSTLLTDFFGKCLSFDFSNYYHVILIYRVSKVFSHPDLIHILKLSETLLLDTSVDHHGHHSMKHSVVTTPHSLKASFLECCGPDFMYTPLFYDRTVQDIQRLLVRIIKSKDAMAGYLDNTMKAKTKEPPAVPPQGSENWSIFNKVAGFFSGDHPSNMQSYMEDDGDETRIVPMLDAAAANLSKIYQLSTDILPASSSFNVTSPSFIKQGESKDNKVLHTSKLSITCRNDPLLQPLRSYENSVLVHKLLGLSSRLNQRFSTQLGAIASGNSSILYRPLSLLLSAPPKPTDGNSPALPRINLRPFASYYNILLLLTITILAHYFSFSHILTAVLFLLTCLYIIRHNK